MKETMDKRNPLFLSPPEFLLSEFDCFILFLIYTLEKTACIGKRIWCRERVCACEEGVYLSEKNLSVSALQLKVYDFS